MTKSDSSALECRLAGTLAQAMRASEIATETNELLRHLVDELKALTRAIDAAIPEDRDSVWAVESVAAEARQRRNDSASRRTTLARLPENIEGVRPLIERVANSLPDDPPIRE